MTRRKMWHALLLVVPFCWARDAHAGDDDASAKDAKALQGEWVAVGEEFGGKKMTKDQLRDANKRLTVKGNKFVIKRVAGGKLGSYEGRFEVDATATPKRFDWSGKGPAGAAIEWVGIDELDGDKFRLCYIRGGPGAKRPGEFKTSAKGGGTFIEFRRDTSE